MPTETDSTFCGDYERALYALRHCGKRILTSTSLLHATMLADRERLTA
jgi:hypothetical protein